MNREHEKAMNYHRQIPQEHLLLLHRRHFTLVEFMIAMTLGLVILALTLALLLYPYRIWEQLSAQFQVDQQMRLVRGRILHGIDGHYGLRSARLASIHIKPGNSKRVEWIDFDVDDNDPPTPDVTNDDTTCRIMITPNRGLKAHTVPHTGNWTYLVKAPIKTEKFLVTKNGRTIHVILALELTQGGQTYTRQQEFDVYIRND